MILPMQRESCGLSWFGVSFSLLQTWNGNVRKSDSFIHHSDVLRHCPHLHGPGWAPASNLQLLKGGREEAGVRPHGTPAILVNYEHRHVGKGDGKMECICRLQVSSQGRWGERIVMDSWQSSSCILSAKCLPSWCLRWLVEVKAYLNLYYNFTQWHGVPVTVFSWDDRSRQDEVLLSWVQDDGQ